MHSIVRCIFRATIPVLSAAACIAMVGCTASQSRRAEEKHASIRAGDIKVSAEQLRLRMRSLVGPMCGQIEQSADAIRAGTTDLNLKLAALEWEIDAVPAMREALYRPDPYTAAVDTAVLCCQMTDYFESGPGKQALGAASGQAAAACRQMTDQYFQVLASGTFSGDVSKGRAFAQKWAADHPIRYSISGRESALSRVFEQDFADSRSATEYIANAAATADDLTRKSDVYTQQLFRQMQWEVERVRLEMVRDYRVDQAIPLAERAVTLGQQGMTTIDHLAPDLERSLSIAQDAPKLVVSERQTILKSLHQEIESQRVAALEQVDKERIVAMQQLHDALADHAKQLTTEADEISARKIDEVMGRVTRLVIIIAALMAAVLGLLIVGGLVVRFRSRAPRGARQ